jgi:hypothetical protein
MSPQQFGNFVGFLEDQHELVTKVDARYTDIMHLKSQEKFDAAHRFLDALETWHREVHNWLEGFYKIGVAAGAGASAAAISLGVSISRRQFFVGAGRVLIAGAAAGAAGAIPGEAFVDHFVRKEQIRVVQWYDRWVAAS